METARPSGFQKVAGEIYFKTLSAFRERALGYKYIRVMEKMQNHFFSPGFHDSRPKVINCLVYPKSVFFSIYTMPKHIGKDKAIKAKAFFFVVVVSFLIRLITPS